MKQWNNETNNETMKNNEQQTMKPLEKEEPNSDGLQIIIFFEKINKDS